MATPILMPKPDAAVEECTLIAWHVQRGDQVKAGDILADVETEKATFELEAPANGKVLDLFFEAGDRVPVLKNVAVIGEAGEDVEAFRPRAEDAPLSPRARRFLDEHPFDCSAVRGTGPGGRIVERDLIIAHQDAPRLSRTAAAPPQEPMIPAMETGKEVMPLTNLRKVIGKRMRQSLDTAAQYTLEAQADLTALLALRERIKSRDAAPELGKAGMNDMLMYAAIQALKAQPELNAELIDNEIHRYAAINLGFACDTSRGLLVPVVCDCQELCLAELSAKVQELATQAIEGTISPDLLRGGTFTVSNLGGLGITSFSPVIHTPQVAILGICAPRLVPVREDGEVVFKEHITFSLTCDHRVIDGAPGARFLKALKEVVETGMGLGGEA